MYAVFLPSLPHILIARSPPQDASNVPAGFHATNQHRASGCALTLCRSSSAPFISYNWIIFVIIWHVSLPPSATLFSLKCHTTSRLLFISGFPLPVLCFSVFLLIQMHSSSATIRTVAKVIMNVGNNNKKSLNVKFIHVIILNCTFILKLYFMYKFLFNYFNGWRQTLSNTAIIWFNLI